MYKYCALLSLCAGLSLAADFLTGQGARLVIGQETFTAQRAGADQNLVGAAGGLAFANGKLYVADSNRLGLEPVNHRVMRFDVTGFPKALDIIPAYVSRCPVCVGTADLVLGQANYTDHEFATKNNRMREPNGVATDGQSLAVADTRNNRVLIWRTLPTTQNQPADVVLGQPNFDTVRVLQPGVVDAQQLRAPQGVWIQDGRLYVADTQNHRVLVWNSIPAQNGQAADLVLGQANFNVAVEPDLTQAEVVARADTLLNPVAVTSDGTHLFITDLGHNRVLIWNSIPSRNQQPADVVIGQEDFTGAIANDTPSLCDPLDVDGEEGPDEDDDGNILYPIRCGRTLNFPRFTLAGGGRLFIADGGNDRVLIYNSIPTENGAKADVILGQRDEFQSAVTSVSDLFNPLLRQSGADITATPTGLAWDGENLYVTDPSNRRVLVFTPGESKIAINAVRNSASLEIFALGSMGIRLAQRLENGVVVDGEITAGEKVTLKIRTREYTYTVVNNDTLQSIMEKVAALVNEDAGDPEVFTKYEPSLNLIKLQAKVGGREGNDIEISATVTALEGEDSANIQAATSGTFLDGGENATVIAPGTLVTVQGLDLSDITATADLQARNLPHDLGGVQAYFDGIRSPLLFVSNGQVNAQVPFEVYGSNNISFYLRIEKSTGTIATTAIAVPIDEYNPGIYAQMGDEPRRVYAWHASSHATGTITVDGNIEQGDTATIRVEDRQYVYTVKADDTLESVRDALVALVNANPEEAVIAVPVGRVAGASRMQLRSKIPGPAGEGITYTATSAEGNNDSVFLVLSSTSANLCCANVAGAPVTALNPAVPGETIYIYATGVGPVEPTNAFIATQTGEIYSGPERNNPIQFVNAEAGGSTINIISAGIEPGTHALYRVVLELSPGMEVFQGAVNMWIAQDIYTSNIVTLPARNPVASDFGQ